MEIHYNSVPVTAMREYKVRGACSICGRTDSHPYDALIIGVRCKVDVEKVEAMCAEANYSPAANYRSHRFGTSEIALPFCSHDASKLKVLRERLEQSRRISLDQLIKQA
ncbi:hypothetical protein HZC30_03835 [Candidatus Woesearchaeota archaeon]|nr:hypothetical protein [Candidatus Woesearchaeota archaeon]